MPHLQPVVASVLGAIREGVKLVLGPITHPVGAVGLQAKALCLVDGFALLGTLGAHNGEVGIPVTCHALEDKWCRRGAGRLVGSEEP